MTDRSSGLHGCWHLGRVTGHEPAAKRGRAGYSSAKDGQQTD
jgi:hypothetical protein